MVPRSQQPAEKQVRELAAAFEAKAAAELTAADSLAPGSDVVASRGCLLADVVVVKGLPGPAESSGGSALSGADGEAIDKALAALGHDLERVFYMLSRPEPSLSATERSARLRAAVEAVDGELVIALDEHAAADLADAFGLKRLTPGRAVASWGRRLVAVGGFEASLGDERDKTVVWRQLQAAATPRRPVL